MPISLLLIDIKRLPLLRGDRGVWHRSLKTRCNWCKQCNIMQNEKCNANDAIDANCIIPLLRGDRGVWHRSLKTRCNWGKWCNAIKNQKCDENDANDANWKLGVFKINYLLQFYITYWSLIRQNYYNTVIIEFYMTIYSLNLKLNILNSVFTIVMFFRYKTRPEEGINFK